MMPAAQKVGKDECRNGSAGGDSPDAVTSNIGYVPRFPAMSKATQAGLSREARVASPPSPESPWMPLPAIVVIVPAGVIFRIR